MREQLLGYLLGALEPEECQRVERHLEDDPLARRELELLSLSLVPLAADAEHHSPPAGLARRTCDYVSLRSETLASTRAFVAPSTWQLQDLLIAAGVFVAACLLFFPAVNHSRFQARVAMCQNNLRALGQALASYSEHQGGFFPVVPTDGKYAVAGIYAPTLVEQRFLDESRHLICPESFLAEEAGFQVPSLAVIQSATGAALTKLQRLMGGSYGYSFGYLMGDRYRGHRNQSRPQFALMADSPSLELADHQSRNHGTCGQNVLFEDGRVQFVSGCRAEAAGPCDHFFTNEAGLVAAGAHADDAVIGPSYLGPLVPVADAASAIVPEN